MPEPAAEPDEVKLAEARGPNHAPRAPRTDPRHTVLVVDDENTVRSFLKAYLEDADYAVCEAGDVDSALTALDDTSVDAVVLDVRMPDPMGWGRTGLEVLAFIRLHAAFETLPVLILTGHPLDPEEHDLIRRHRAHLFLKPDGYRMLLLRLKQLTDR
jgi:DNA-binding response OmpR family regulator